MPRPDGEDPQLDVSEILQPRYRFDRAALTRAALLDVSAAAELTVIEERQ